MRSKCKTCRTRLNYRNVGSKGRCHPCASKVGVITEESKAEEKAERKAQRVNERRERPMQVTHTGLETRVGRSNTDTRPVPLTGEAAVLEVRQLPSEAIVRYAEYRAMGWPHSSAMNSIRS